MNAIIAKCVTGRLFVVGLERGPYAFLVSLLARKGYDGCVAASNG